MYLENDIIVVTYEHLTYSQSILLNIIPTL